MSWDPIGEQGGVNLYVFLWNDPIYRIDFRGLVDIYLTHRRTSRDYFGTYGTISTTVPDAGTLLKIRSCCGDPPETYLTIEPPPNAQNPRGEDRGGGFFSGLHNKSFGNAYLKSGSINSIDAMIGNAEIHRPAGLENEEWDDLRTYALATGIGQINIHVGTTSLSSGGCILPGSNYVAQSFQVPAGGSYVGLDASKTYKDATGFDFDDSADAQVILTYYIWCARKALGGKVSVKYRLEGSTVPPLATDPMKANDLPPVPLPGLPSQSGNSGGFRDFLNNLFN